MTGVRLTKRPSKRVTQDGLTIEQEAYARARAMGMSIAESITTAGLTVKEFTAKGWEAPESKTYKKALVDRIMHLAQLATENAIINTGLDREWVIGRLMSVAERCMQAEPVRDGKGEIVEGQFQFDAKGAIGALKLLGDTMGVFKPLPKAPEDDFKNLSDEELERIALELAKRNGLVLENGAEPH